MKAKIFKLLIPAPIGAGSICLTMKLTNQANTSLIGLGELELESIPKLLENEIKPYHPPVQKQKQQQPPTSGEGDGNKGEKDQNQDDTNKDQKEQSPSSSSASVAAEDVIKLLQKQIMNITTNSTKWLEHSKELSSVHSVVSSISTLISSLEVFKKQTTPKPAAGTGGDPQGGQAQEPST